MIAFLKKGDLTSWIFMGVVGFLIILAIVTNVVSWISVLFRKRNGNKRQTKEG